jgi:hypothetical protein
MRQTISKYEGHPTSGCRDIKRYCCLVVLAQKIGSIHIVSDDQSSKVEFLELDAQTWKSRAIVCAPDDFQV